MTRVLAIEVMNDYRIQEQHYFKACEDYDECDSKRRSSSIDVGSTVLVHTPQPVGVCGKLYSSWKGYFKVLKVFADNPNVYLVCHENDKKRQKLVHRDILRVVDVPDKNEETIMNQQSPEMLAVGASGPDLKNLKPDFQEESIVKDVNDDTEEYTTKRKLRSGKTY